MGIRVCRGDEVISKSDDVRGEEKEEVGRERKEKQDHKWEKDRSQVIGNIQEGSCDGTGRCLAGRGRGEFGAHCSVWYVCVEYEW